MLAKSGRSLSFVSESDEPASARNSPLLQRSLSNVSAFSPRKSSTFNPRGLPKPVNGFPRPIDLVDQISNKLKDASSEPFSYITITGMGGVGKSQLAKMCIRSCLINFDNIIWINSETEETIKASFYELAKQLKINGTKDLDEIVRNIYKEKCVSRTVIVFDNAALGLEVNEDSKKEKYGEVIKQFLPSVSEHRSWCIVTTCRNPNGLGFPNEFTIRLECLNDNDGGKYIQEKLTFPKDDYDFDNCKKLCRLLGGLPFALYWTVDKIFSDEKSFHRDDMWTMRQHVDEYIQNFEKKLENHSFRKMFEKYQDIFCFNSTEQLSLNFIVTTIIKIESCVDNQKLKYQQQLNSHISDTVYFDLDKLNQIHRDNEEIVFGSIETELQKFSVSRRSFVQNKVKNKIEQIFQSVSEKVTQNNERILKETTVWIVTQFEMKLKEIFPDCSAWSNGKFKIVVNETKSISIVEFHEIISKPLETHLENLNEKFDKVIKSFQLNMENQIISQILKEIQNSYIEFFKKLANYNFNFNSASPHRILDNNFLVMILSQFWQKIAPLNLEAERLLQVKSEFHLMLSQAVDKVRELNISEQKILEFGIRNQILEAEKDFRTKISTTSCELSACCLYNSFQVVQEEIVEKVNKKWTEQNFNVNLLERSKNDLDTYLDKVLDEFMKEQEEFDKEENVKCQKMLKNSLEEYKAILCVITSQNSLTAISSPRIEKITQFVRSNFERKLKEGNSKQILHFLQQFDDKAETETVELFRNNQLQLLKATVEKEKLLMEAQLNYSKTISQLQENCDTMKLELENEKAKKEFLNLVQNFSIEKSVSEKVQKVLEKEFESVKELFQVQTDIRNKYFGLLKDNAEMEYKENLGRAILNNLVDKKEEEFEKLEQQVFDRIVKKLIDELCKVDEKLNRDEIEIGKIVQDLKNRSKAFVSVQQMEFKKVSLGSG